MGMTKIQNKITKRFGRGHLFRFWKLNIGICLVFVSCLLVILSTSNEVQAATTISRPVNNLGLVGYWNFNSGKGTAIAWDLSGNGNNGKLTTMDPATDWVDSKSGLGTALDFDGSNDYIAVESLDASLWTNNTISFWFKPGVASLEDRYIFWINANPVAITEYVFVRFTGGQLFLDVKTGGSDYNSTSNWTTWTAGTWYHVVLIFGTGQRRIYINGVLDSTNTQTNSASLLTGASSVGLTLMSSNFNGTRPSSPVGATLDEFRIYNRALSATEIKRLYNLTQPKIATVPISNGLVGYWDFNSGKGKDIAWDLSGNGNNGRLTSMDPATDWVDSKTGLGTALDFDGSNDYVDMGTPSTLNLTSNFSLSAWVRISTVANANQIISKGYDALNTQWEMKTTTAGGNVSLQTFVNPSSFGVQSISTLSANTWTHIVGTRDATTWRIYWNGVLDNSNVSTGPTATAEKVAVGAVMSSGAPTQFWNGLIDEVRIYNRVLSATEIKRLYNLTQPKIATVPLSNGLVGYWDFNFGKGKDIAWDLSGNGNNGKLTSMDPASDWVDSKSGLGTALDFDGSNDYVELPTSTLVNVSPLSISAWIKPSNLSGVGVIIGKGEAVYPVDNGWVLRRSGATLDFDVDTTSGHPLYIPNGDLLTANKWHHVVFTWDGNVTGTNAKWYVNGVNKTLANIAGSGSRTSDSGYSPYIGALCSGCYFNGQIDEVRIYNRALSAEEIKRLYLLGN
ncbi:MAG: hypothetical protein A3B91_03460 [Candidatus Yanofskybacteria bacterium RIFCSPHIGHO2_02_FULL_41_29]|nr:MAG: hypothetical protein A3B91_03460 [Candidatus Yanofskybacteria bacterium RIFCSPHIGHO2_02_FULL_41_29]